jgi:class 3 adenylate cyclase/tetratricopeptide (TPR) repeat protein
LPKIHFADAVDGTTSIAAIAAVHPNIARLIAALPSLPTIGTSRLYHRPVTADSPAVQSRDGAPPLRTFLPDVVRHPDLASLGSPFTRDAVTLFLDVQGFTGLSERLARHGTAGTEQLGAVVRRVIGGALDVIHDEGGDALTFGGDAVTAAFAGRDASLHGRRAADAVVSLVRSAAGQPTLAGPIDVSVRVGLAGGRITSLVCPARTRHVVAHVGPGLDAAVAAQARALPDTVARDPSSELPATPIDAAPEAPSPAWASRTLHPVTASRVLAHTPLPDEHRRVTSVFIELPAVDDTDAGALASFGAFVATAADAISDAGGDLLQCAGGDKGVVLFAVFGAPVAHPDDAARGVHAVELIRSRTGVRFRAGVATGLAFAAAYGGQHRTFLTALGDTTNLAARLMGSARPGATEVDERTARAARGLVQVGGTTIRALRGKSAPVATVPVAGLGDPQAALDSAGRTALVGRQAELRTAEALLDRLAEGRGTVLEIVGEAGSGKTRLGAEIARRAGVRGAVVWVGAFEAFGLGRPLGPFVRLLRERLGLGVDAGGDELRAAVATLVPGRVQLVPLLAGVLDMEVAETPATAGLRDEQRSELALRLVVDVVCAGDEPTLLVLEDAHWADEASARLLADLVTRVASIPLAAVLTRRAEASPLADAGGAHEVWSITLGDLSREELATVVRDTWSGLGGGDLPDWYISTVVERSAGSPLFAVTVTELVRRGFEPGSPLAPVPLPDDLWPFLTARLDELGDGAQRAALCAAVLGRPASSAELAVVFGLDPGQTDRDVGALVTAGIARGQPGGGETVWLRHASLAEALLARASHADRRPLHARVSRHLVALGASGREVARHLEHCHLADLELDWYRRARVEAWATWALVEARHWGELAVAAGGDQADQIGLAEIEQQLGDSDRARERLSALVPDPAFHGTVERLLGRIALETGRLDDAVTHLERAEDAGEPPAAVSWPLTMALCELGRFDEARERTIVQLRAAGNDDRRLRLDALANLGAIAARTGALEEAAQALEEARVLASELGDVLRLAIITGDLAGANFISGRVADAAALLADATALAHGLGARRVVAMMLGNLTQVRLAGGDRNGANRAAAATARTALAIGDVGMALDVLQVPAVTSELDGERDRAAGLWRRHAVLEEALGRRHDAALSWFRVAALLGAVDPPAARAAMRRADEDAGATRTDDLELQRGRADAALRGRPEPPPEAATTPVDLPVLDAALAPVTQETFDELFAEVEQRIRAG